MTEELAQYRKKRDLARSGEPSAGKPTEGGPLTFVIQKHRARRLHYDLRLEVDGVLKSWAVPKGPSYDPTQKRLAAMVEDHPLDYASFEGVIPHGEYGAGEVIVWDSGTYSPDENGEYLFTDREQAQAVMRKAISDGKISFFLRGQKLRGSWTLVKVRARPKDWLLIKHHDEHASESRDVLSEERSVISGRTLDDVKQGVAADGIAPKQTDLKSIEGAEQSDFPGFVAPMLASIADSPFSNPSWVFEPKLDGYRLVASVRNGEVRLWSRRGNEVTEKYSVLLPALRSQPASEVVLDGELVATDERGQVSFESLQQYLQHQGVQENGHRTPLIYYVFDILYLDGFDLRNVILTSRKKVLNSSLRPSNQIRLIEYFQADGKAVFDAAIKNGLEGVIGKNTESLYQSGRRSRDWLKVKALQTDDFIVGGYTAGEGVRSGSIGALLLGYRDDKNRLMYAGHVGSGFNENSLSTVKERLDTLRASHSPFDTKPSTNTAPTWVRPELVAEVKYSQWTRDGRLRSPVFLRIRDDKPATDVRRAEVVAAPEESSSPSETDTIASLLEQLSNEKQSFTIEVGSQKINLGNLEKELWPAFASQPPVTKRQFLKYLARVSPYLLPHLKNRPITLSRYPHGINGQHFWQKHWNLPIPYYVTTLNISEETGKTAEYIVCDNLPTLMWLGQAADIEFHTWFSRTESAPDLQEEMSSDRVLDYPDFIVFDLDPYIYSGHEEAGEEPEFNRAGFDKACEVARRLKEVLDSLSLNAFIKTSGKTGLHIYVPVVRKLDFRSSRRAAETIGQFLMRRHANDITMEWAVERRNGKIFIDYAQNVRGKTLASIYSPRPHDGATVSFPLRWDDLGKAYPEDYTILTVPDILARQGDLWRGILQAKRDIAETLGIK